MLCSVGNGTHTFYGPRCIGHTLRQNEHTLRQDSYFNGSQGPPHNLAAQSGRRTSPMPHEGRSETESTRFEHEGTVHFEKVKRKSNDAAASEKSLSTSQTSMNNVTDGSTGERERSGHAAPSADAVLLLPPPVLVARRDGGGKESQRRRRRLIQSPDGHRSARGASTLAPVYPREQVRALARAFHRKRGAA